MRNNPNDPEELLGYDLIGYCDGGGFEYHTDTEFPIDAFSGVDALKKLKKTLKKIRVEHPTFIPIRIVRKTRSLLFSFNPIGKYKITKEILDDVEWRESRRYMHLQPPELSRTKKKK